MSTADECRRSMVINYATPSGMSFPDFLLLMHQSYGFAAHMLLSFGINILFLQTHLNQLLKRLLPNGGAGQFVHPVALACVDVDDDAVDFSPP